MPSLELVEQQEIQDDPRLGGHWGPLSPDGKQIALTMRIDDTMWLGLSTPEGEDLKQVAKLGVDCFNGAWRFSADGKGVYVIVSQYMLRPRQPLSADHPATEDKDDRLLVSPHYAISNDWNRVERNFSEARECARKYFIVYLDLTTRTYHLVFTADDLGDNPSNPLMFLSPDGTKIAAVQTPGDFSPLATKTGSDIYVIDLPPSDQLPVVEIEELLKNDRKAGWTDHLKRPLHPVVSDVGIAEDHRQPLQWSPDGKMLAYAETGSNHAGDVWVYDLESKKLRNLTISADCASLAPRINEPLYGIRQRTNSLRFGSKQAVRWTADGQSLLTTARGYLWQVPVDGSGARNLSLATGPLGIIGTVNSQLAPNVAYEMAPGEVLVLTTEKDTLHDGFGRFNLQTKQLTPLISTDGWIMAALVEGKSGQLFYGKLTPEDLGEMYQFNLAGKDEPRQFTHYSESLKTFRFPEKQLLKYTTKHGQTGWARLHLPAGARPGARWPLIMISEQYGTQGHGDSRHSMGNEVHGVLNLWRAYGPLVLGKEAQMFNRAGYAVLYFDPLWLTSNRDITLRDKILDVYNAAADAVIATDRVDGKHIGLYSDDFSGMNGFAVQVAISGTNRFAAAVSSNSFGSLSEQALSLPPEMQLSGRVRASSKTIEEGVYHMGVPYVGDPQLYERESALPYFAQVKTPLLILQSTGSSSVLSGRADESFSALQVSGTKVVVDHNNKGAFLNSDMKLRAIVWFNEHLRSGPAVSGHATLPVPSSKEVLDAPTIEQVMETAPQN